MTAQQPIGIFDAGLGGLSVARHIRALLPAAYDGSIAPDAEARPATPALGAAQRP